MSGTSWKAQAKKIVVEGQWPKNITPADKQAVEGLASDEDPFEPYYTLKAVIVGIQEGSYIPSKDQTEV